MIYNDFENTTYIISYSDLMEEYHKISNEYCEEQLHELTKEFNSDMSELIHQIDIYDNSNDIYEKIDALTVRFVKQKSKFNRFLINLKNEGWKKYLFIDKRNMFLLDDETYIFYIKICICHDETSPSSVWASEYVQVSKEEYAKIKMFEGDSHV